MLGLQSTSVEPRTPRLQARERLSYFDDAEREAPLPAEGPKDWKTVQEYFQDVVAHLLLPPAASLAIQARRVDVNEEG